MPFRKGIEEGTDDTEGNMPRVKFAKDGVEDDDTEGQGFRGNVADGVEDGVEDDDTEGNAVRSGRTIPPSANPGKAFKPRG